MTEAVRRVESEFAAPDGLRLYERGWLPAERPRGVVLIVHGYAEHCGRYAHAGDYLASNGYAVYAYDQRGHGRSPGRRAAVASCAEYARDLDAYAAIVRGRHDGVPLFLLGHSMGGLVVTLALIAKTVELRGAVLSGPVLPADGFGARVAERMILIIGRIAPGLPLVKLKAADVSRDESVVAAYDSDPLTYRGRLRAGMAAAMTRATRHVRAHRGDVTAPFIIMHGGDDRLATPEGSRALHAAAASSDKTLRIFDGLYHEIMNEPERAQVLDELRAWLDARI